ncbi:MAG TPA: lipid-A-disaccharide synthase [Chlamydiales bacterium]|nr:lipid-A-disaccharide synthase [Chlamydiales bacterium]
MCDLFIVTGEPSGDLHGSLLIQELLKKRPSLKIGAVAGPRMRALPIETFFPMENLQVMGFIDVLFALPKIARQFFAIRKKILKLNPKAVICIDYPGFNLRLERSLREKGYRGKLIHYVCPTVWAWGKKWIPRMAESLDLLLAFFPFEKACFSHTKLSVQTIGHPLASKIAPRSNTIDSKLIALFPGSRQKEIERNLPLQLKTAQKLLLLDPDLKVAISIAHPDFEPLIKKIAQGIPLLFSAENYDLMRSAHLALATSGTVTLELALHRIPTVVNFAIRPLDCFIAQKIFGIDLPFYALPNIIASKSVFPELFGPNLTEEALFFWAQKLCFDPEERKSCLKECDQMRSALDVSNTGSSACTHIFALLDF